jgi:hypothetical protein
MEATSSDRKNFQITENGNQVVELTYDDLLYQKAKLRISDTEYRLSPVGFLDSRMAVTKDGNDIASVEMSWKGQMLITFHNGQEFILRLDGIFNNTYVVENKEREKLIQLDGKFHWRNFRYTYNISYDITKIGTDNGHLLLALSLYATNYFVATMSGASAGVM